MTEVAKERRCLHLGFFFVIQKKSKTLVVTKLNDNQGQVIRERKDLDKNCTHFYSKLYEKNDMSKKTIRI
jgi:hypothetical protein